MTDHLSASSSPFVLLDDARTNGNGARLYRDPRRIIEAHSPDDVPKALDALRAARAERLYAAGFMAYEAGEAFESKVGTLPTPPEPLVWFGLFDRFEEVADASIILPAAEGALIGAPVPLITRASYGDQLATVLQLIRAGDLYQTNLTFRAEAHFKGDPTALYAQLRGRAQAPHSALIDTGRMTVLSLSPERFFLLEGETLTCRPMKGTARRGCTAEEDALLARELSEDAKQRAENLMIVDLMRNDLSRVAVSGSVAVPELFAIETYPTVHQMTSTVTATLATGRDAIDVLAALFPCGSITGAPKVRAMQVISAIEEENPRGVYTGSIGRLDPDGGAAFNVAIRTLVIPHGASRATLGLGSGIVADSNADMEWDECLTKGAFLTDGEAAVRAVRPTKMFDPMNAFHEAIAARC